MSYRIDERLAKLDDIMRATPGYTRELSYDEINAVRECYEYAKAVQGRMDAERRDIMSGRQPCNRVIFRTKDGMECERNVHDLWKYGTPMPLRLRFAVTQRPVIRFDDKPLSVFEPMPIREYEFKDTRWLGMEYGQQIPVYEER